MRIDSGDGQVVLPLDACISYGGRKASGGLDQPHTIEESSLWGARVGCADLTPPPHASPTEPRFA
eukprot:3328646-Prymnesium_polylepis.2